MYSFRGHLQNNEEKIDEKMKILPVSPFKVHHIIVFKAFFKTAS
jgi:hypothetical protein